VEDNAYGRHLCVTKRREYDDRILSHVGSWLLHLVFLSGHEGESRRVREGCACAGVEYKKKFFRGPGRIDFRPFFVKPDQRIAECSLNLGVGPNVKLEAENKIKPIKSFIFNGQRNTQKSKKTFLG
jgi:hypothetical protein